MPANQQDGALPVVEYIAGPDNIWADETSPITAKINLRPESILPSLSCVHPIADPQFLTHFNSKFPYLATHLNWITICLLLATTCSAISPPIHTGSHRLLSHRTIAWLSLTPQVGAIPFALATHSALLPVVSIVVQPDLSVATPLCKATLPDSSFVSYSLPQFLHHLHLQRTPTIFDSTPLNPVLNWFFDHYSLITGIDCSCPHTSLPDQLLSWLCPVFDLIDFLSIPTSNCPASFLLCHCLLTSTVELESRSLT